MRRFPALGWVIALVLACDLVVVGVRSFGAQTRVVVRVHTPPTRVINVLPGGQAKITGHADSLAVDAQTIGVVPTPFTIEVPDRGNGNATIEQAVVDGRRTTIEWNAGRPLPISGPGAGLDVGPVHVDLDRGGVTVPLDGDVRGFAPGDYSVNTSVAVGVNGLATPRDGVHFTADPQTLLTTIGGAGIHAPPRVMHLEGPGKMTARGRFRIETAEGVRDVDSLTFGPGSFVLDLRPVAGGYDVTATLQGPLQSS